MSEDFKWVSEDSPEKSEEEKLPVIIPENTDKPFFQKLLDGTGKAFIVVGTLVLVLLAKLLLLLARIRIRMPEGVKTFFAKIKNWFASLGRPSWLKVPEFLHRIPPHAIEAMITGACFVLVLAGAGAMFPIFMSGGSFMEYLLFIGGIIAGFRLLWKRSLAAILARWLLEVSRGRNARNR